MAMWFWMEDDGHRNGPISSQELKALASAGRIARDTMVAKEGTNGWVSAERVKGLFDAPNPTSESTVGKDNLNAPSPADQVFRKARQHAATVLGDLRSHNWREEVLPIDEFGLRTILRDYVFWCVVLLGVVPSLIGTIQNPAFQLNAYLLFFAAMWGVVFRDFIVRSAVDWKWLIASAAFTGLVGFPMLFLAYSFLPESLLHLPTSSSFISNLVGSILVTGVSEELCKVAPVMIYLLWKRQAAQPMTAILLGVFSGLGFAFVENIGYAKLSMIKPLAGANLGGMDGYVAGMQSAISNTLLRSLSLVFGHAVLAGIVAYFAVMGFLSKRRAIPLAVVGLVLAAILHGCYNWLAPLQRTFATLVDVGAFLLFYGYLIKLRGLIAEQSTPGPNIELSTNAESTAGELYQRQ